MASNTARNGRNDPFCQIDAGVLSAGSGGVLLEGLDGFSLQKGRRFRCFDRRPPVVLEPNGEEGSADQSQVRKRGEFIPKHRLSGI
jgi:hypothetical protein